MLGTLINSLAIIVGTILGLFFKNSINKKLSNTVMQALALCILFIGIDGSLKVNNLLVVIICMASGALIGETIDIDHRLNSLGDKIQSKFKNRNSNISEGFVTATLLFCVGAMAIVGALDSGLRNDYNILISKSILDGISSIIFSSTLGIGVALSAISVLIYQGGITIFATFLSPLLSEAVIGNMTCCGSLLIIGLGLNILGCTKIKISNLLPAVFLPIIADLVVKLF